MSRRVVVAYETKNGSTAEAAEAIASRIRRQGFDVEVGVASEVSDISGTDILVVGAPIYSGLWLKGAHRVLKRLGRVPKNRRPPVAIFALGPRQDDSPEDWVRPRQQFERALAKHPEVEPATTALFGGADPPKKEPRRDIRNWDAIQAWADEVAALVDSPEVRTPHRTSGSS